MPAESALSNEEQALLASVRGALREDVRTGDVTCAATVPEGTRGRGRLVVREDAVIAGLDVARSCFAEVDPEVEFVSVAKDGQRLAAGSLVATVEGSLTSILTAERTALNFLQRGCGIATATRRLVDQVAEYGVSVLDTRKTVPGLRVFDKLAVKAGGGTNHRMALDDLILVKDNHVIAAGGLRQAVTGALAAAGDDLEVEVEVDSLDQLDEMLTYPELPQSVLLDNFTPEEVADAVARIKGRLRIEVSGNITKDTILAYAQARPDAISLGALTHSVRAVDLGLDLECG